MNLRSNMHEAASFDDVFSAELDCIDDRLKKTRSNESYRCGLPAFESNLVDEQKRSDSLKNLLNDLRGDKDSQDAVWETWTKGRQEAGRPAHGGLVGLAFSGGGIRSATFNLGIVQALQKCGLFKCIDYLSTVSGGGYIGSCLSALLTTNNEFPFEHDQGVEEPAPFRHLRNNANYLAPGGLSDALVIPAILLRGIFINFLIILPYILLLAWLTVSVNPLGMDLIENIFWRDWVPDSVFGFPKDDLPAIVRIFLISEALLAILFVIFAVYPVIQVVAERNNYFGLGHWPLRKLFGRLLAGLIIAIGISIFIEAQPLAVYEFNRFLIYLGKNQIDVDWVGGISVAIAILAGAFGQKLSSNVGSLAGKIGVYLLAAAGFFMFWLVYLLLCRWAIVWDAQQISAAAGLKQNQFLFWYAVTAVGLYLYSFLFVDVNYSSIHNFYRDRLSRAYLIKRVSDGDENGVPREKVEHDDTLCLSNLNATNAPYHLINAALNVTQTKERYQRGRRSDFFLFSKKFIGSRATGYCSTEVMETVRPHVNLGTAMAISGAAAAANAGKVSVKPLAFILAMLNIRLNYWLPNPRKIGRQLRFAFLQKWTFALLRVGPPYLLIEALGRMGADDNQVNVSDGGHIENLGIYELLARQCRLIIVGDGECDPGLEFGALAEVIRMAQIDMGIQVDMKGLDEIRHGRQNFAVGTIKYAGDRYGKLLYLKSSLLGDDTLNSTLPNDAYVRSPRRNDDRLYDFNPYIARYKAKNPAFPHETTADQFFDEIQFESYRALGFSVGMRALRREHGVKVGATAGNDGDDPAPPE